MRTIDWDQVDWTKVGPGQETDRDVATRLGCSVHTVRKRRIALRLLYPRTPPLPWTKRWSREDLAGLYVTESLKSIAVKYGVTKQRVQQLAKNFGIKDTRTKSEIMRQARAKRLGLANGNPAKEEER